MILSLDDKPKNAIAAIDSVGASLSYGELIDFSCSIGQAMPARSVVFVLCGNNVGGVAWSIGLINAGIVPLLINPHIENDLFEYLFNTYQPQYICVEDAQVCKYEGEVVYRALGYSALCTNNPSYPVYKELSHLLSTSGSTGSPKLVRHSYSNINFSALNVSAFFELDTSVRSLLVLPLYYTMGLSVVFSHLFVGATVLITDLSMTDGAFWKFIKELKATSFTGVPYSFEILNKLRFMRMQLPDMTLLTQGGGKMPKDLNVAFAEYCRDNGKRWVATYGQTEGTARMAYLPHEQALNKIGSIGRAIPNAELYLIDEQGDRIEQHHVEGEMCYRGGNVTLGYAVKKEDLLLGDERNGVLRTGDIAYKDEDGCFYIVGRMGRFLKLYGMRVGLDDCEQLLRSEFSIDCACVGNDEQMLIYTTSECCGSIIPDFLSKKTGVIQTAFKVVRIDEIPKSEAGKIQYSKLNNN